MGYESVVNRWNFVKGLDGIHNEKELLASFSKYRRKNIRIAQDSGLRVRRLERGELSTFVKLCDMSAARQGFKSRDLAYYERLFDTFGDLIEFKVVETHFDEYLDTLQSKLNAASKDKRNLERLLQRTQQQPEGTAKKGASDPATLEKRIATADKKIAALEKTIGEVNGIIASDGPVIPVEAGVYFWHPNEVVCLSSGEDDRFMDYYPSSLIHSRRCLTASPVAWSASTSTAFPAFSTPTILPTASGSSRLASADSWKSFRASSRCRWTDCASVYPKQRTSCCIADKQWRARTQK